MAANEIILNSLKRVHKIEDDTIREFSKVLKRFERFLIRNVSTLPLARRGAERLADVATAYQNTAQMLTDSGYYEVVGRMLNEDRQELLNISFRQYRRMFGFS